MADYSKDDAETRRARAEAKEMAEQKRNERLYEASRTTPYKKGGTASARADGIASKGKTRGTLIAMCGGGKAKK
jgi:hypothetical protein